MPAAAWAARSGDPVLFVKKETAPEPTLDALRRHRGVPVYVLGPPSVISDKTLEAVRKLAPSTRRIGARRTPVQNAIAFARYTSGSFGWDINDPGHGFVIANASRPLDAAAAAPLSASGTWGPLLITRRRRPRSPLRCANTCSTSSRATLGDPTRAVYNHVWVIGDEGAISVDFQSQVDDLAEVVQVRSGRGAQLGPPPGTPEQRGESAVTATSSENP